MGPVGKREQPAMETFGRLAQVTEECCISLCARPILMQRTASSATDDEACRKIKRYDPASPTDGPVKNGRTDKTGNWPTGGAIVRFPGRYCKGERESSAPRTPGPYTKCSGSAPEHAEEAVIFTDWLLGLGEVALPRPPAGGAAPCFWPKQYATWGCAPGQTSNFSTSEHTGALRGAKWRILK